MNTTDYRKLGYAALLIVVIVLALALRLDGSRYRMYQDETIYIFQTMSVGQLDLAEVHVGIAPILLFGFYALVYGLGYLLGLFRSVQDFLAVYYTDMYTFFLLGRVAEAIMGTLSVLVLYLLGKKMWNRRVGLIAAFFMSISYVDVNVSQIARGQAFATFFIIASFYFIYQVYERGWGRDYLLAVFFGGLAGAIRIMSLYLLMPLVVAHFARGNHLKSFKSFSRSLLQIVGASLGMIGFMFLSNPDNWFHPQRMIEHPLSILGMVGVVSKESVTIGSYRLSPIYYLTEGLPMAYGWVMVIIVGAGFIYALLHWKDRRNWIILSGALSYLIVVSKGSIASFRYLFPSSFLFLLLGSVFVIGSSERIKVSSARRSAILCFSLLLIGIQPVWYVLQKNRIRIAPRTQVISAEWIFQNVPHGAVVAADSMGELGPDLKKFPVIDYEIFNLSDQELIELYRKRIASEPGGSRVLKSFIENPPYPRYRIFNLGTRELVDLEMLKREKVEYVVTSSRVRELVSEQHIKAKFPDIYQSRRGLYSWLKENGELIKSFSPDSGIVGPTINIYRLRSPDSQSNVVFHN